MGFLDKLKAGLGKTKNALMGQIDNVLKTFVKIDEDALEELEEALICADVGVSATEEIIETLRERIKDDRLKSREDTEIAIREIIAEMIGDGEPLNLSTTPSVILVIGVNGAGKTSLFRIITGHKHAVDVLYYLNKSARTSLLTKATSDTFSRINMCNSIFNAYCILRAHRHAVTKAYTAVDAFSLTAKHKLCSLAGLNTHVIHFVRRMLAVAVAMHNGNSFNYVGDLNTKYIGDCLRRSVTARYAKTCRNTVLACQRLSISVTARISARSAVSTRETLAYFRVLFVLLYGKSL